MVMLQAPYKAAQYLRMSTEHQQYSIANQRAAIAQYAADHQIEIISTYEDSGKSGLTLAGRPALRRLLSDVTSGQSAFDTILVYDVSRWGRFQDADESAHLEYLCRLSGVRLIYCAETFPNDGTPFASICKVVKRALAAEYSRELSEKVFRGKKRLIEMGFRQGGSAGIGLRRCLISTNGEPKAILGHGERKSIATDRIILIPGPADEVAVVRRMYRAYVERDMGCIAIADELNRKGIPSESGRPWTRAVVKRVLTSAKYVGDNVWARTSYTLKVARRQNASDAWVQACGAFEGIISRALFEAAQQKRRARCLRLSDAEIIRRLRLIYGRHGRITARLIKQDGAVGVLCVRKRFGSIVKAAECAGYVPSRNLAFLQHNAQAQTVRAALAEDLKTRFALKGHRVDRLSGACRFVINSEVCFTVAVAQVRRCQSGVPGWLVKPAETSCDFRVAVLLDAELKQSSVWLFPADDLPKECLLYARNAGDLEALRLADLQHLVDACARETLDTTYKPVLAEAAPQSAGEAHCLPNRQKRTVRLRRMRCRTYLGAFRRASHVLREMICRASSVSRRLWQLRNCFALVLSDPRFISILRSERILDVPIALRHREQHLLEAEQRRFREHLHATVLEFDVGGQLPLRAQKLLLKLRPKSRTEAMQLMILANDPGEAFARALVGATPARGTYAPNRRRVYGLSEQDCAALVRERAYLLQHALPGLAPMGRDARDLVVVECFARRVLSLLSAKRWLKQHFAPAHEIFKQSLLP